MNNIGVLAVQGGFRLHQEALERLGVDPIAVRTPGDLNRVSALVMPGGESTAISKLMAASGLDAAIAGRAEAGDLPVFGTCAGMILCARDIADGAVGQASLGLFKARVRRNGLGNQQQSREVAISVKDLDESFTAIFIRPPVVDELDGDVEVLATWRDRPILCRQGPSLFASFHPELTGDSRIHELFLKGL